MSYWEELDQKGSMRVLLTLLEQGERNLTELREIEGIGLNALYNVLEGLKRIELVTINMLLLEVYIPDLYFNLHSL